MYRVVRSGHQWYAWEIGELDEQAIEDIQEFVDLGEPVLLTSDLDSLSILDIDADDIEIIEP